MAQGRELVELATPLSMPSPVVDYVPPEQVGPWQDMGQHRGADTQQAASQPSERAPLCMLSPVAEDSSYKEVEFMPTSNYWRYCPANNKKIPTRETPDVAGNKTKHILKPGDTFRAVEEKPSAEGILYLKLEGDRGWLFDHKPDVGDMCVRTTEPTEDDTVGSNLSVPDLLIGPRQYSMKAQATVQRMFPEYKRPLGNFNIQGYESQILHASLNMEEKILVESGGMRYLSTGITPDLRMGNFAACCCGGEELFRVVYTNEEGDDGALIGIAPPFNANIIPVDLNIFPDLVIRGGSFLAAFDVDLDIETRRVKNLAGVMGGHGLLVHPLKGKGIVFLNAGGSIMTKTLGEKEELYASSGSVVAFQDSIDFSVEYVGGGMKNVCCGGQGLVNTKLVGPGLVILQSLSLSELRSAIHYTR